MEGDEECDWGLGNLLLPDSCRPNCRLPRCGDGITDAGEECDRTAVGACADAGFTRGQLGCRDDCTFDTTTCSRCGNGQAEGQDANDSAFEICDGGDVRGASCASLERGGGQLACTPACTLDLAGCDDPVPRCGNGLPEGGETCDDQNAVAHDGCSDACRTERVVCTEVVEPATSEGLLFFGAAYDTRRAVVVAFGNRFDEDTQEYGPAELWELAGERWTQVQIASPPLEIGASIAYDEGRGRIVYFGAQNDGTVAPTVTWEYDGVDSRDVASAVAPEWPASETTPPIAYDSRRQVTVFAGPDTTWEYDGTTWTPTPHPTPVLAAGITAYDPERGVVVLAGALDATGHRSTWEYDGTGWTGGEDPAGFELQYGHSLVYDTARRRVVAYRQRDALFDPNPSQSLFEYLGQGQGWQPIEVLDAPQTYGGETYDPVKAEYVMVLAPSHRTICQWTAE